MAERRPPYVMIVGHGRSGTNWFLDLLDLSLETHCRSEMNEVPGAALAGLPGALFVGTADAALETTWDAAVHMTSMRMGERDHRALPPKVYIHEASRRLGLGLLVRRRPLRRMLASVVPSLRGAEWRLPGWLGSEARLADALPVLKLLQVPGWSAWVLRNRPQVLLLHIVRHPGGFLNSWRKRYLALHDQSEVAAANLVRLRRLVEVDPSWGPAMGPLDAMSVEESELWYWRYTTESIHAAGSGSAGYRLLVYERLASDALGVMREVYSACGLPWTPQVERGIKELAAKSVSIADAWHDELSDSHRAALARVLDGSVLRGLWGEAS